jgi:hypothetical protein
MTMFIITIKIFLQHVRPERLNWAAAGVLLTLAAVFDRLFCNNLAFKISPATVNSFVFQTLCSVSAFGLNFRGGPIPDLKPT